MSVEVGKHLILEVFTRDSSVLINADSCQIVMRNVLNSHNVTIITDFWHSFGDRCGYTGVIILAESHFSIHTWPEKNYASIDLFLCGDDFDEERITEIAVDIEKYFNPFNAGFKIIKRPDLTLITE